MTNPVVQPIVIDRPLDDPDAVRALVVEHGPYPSIGSYLPASATRGGPDGGGEPVLPWFRRNWAVRGRAVIDGAEALLHNPRLIEAACRLFDVPSVTPNTLLVNVNAPMPAGAIHVDIPSFRGADRDRYPLRLLQAMGASELFEPWRIEEAGAICWFYDGPGGAYDFWPEGPGGPMHTMAPPFGDVALVGDNDRMYHRIGWIGDPAPPVPDLTPSAQIERRRDGRWQITDGDAVHGDYGDEQIRISILWKARVDRPRTSEQPTENLTDERMAQIVTEDLRQRGIEASTPDAPLTAGPWIDLVHATYYPVDPTVPT